MKRRFHRLTVMMLVLLCGCGAGKVYLIDLQYVPQVPPSLKSGPRTVAVAPFVDRKSGAHEIGIRKKLDGSLDRFTTGRLSVNEAVRRAVEGFLRENGFRVMEIQQWDLTAESLSTIAADLVVGGRIGRFWSTAESMAGRTVVRTETVLTVYLGKPQERKVIRQTVEISREVTQIVFSPEKVEALFNESLSEIIESAFEKLLGRVSHQGLALLATDTWANSVGSTEPDSRQAGKGSGRERPVPMGKRHFVLLNDEDHLVATEKSPFRSLNEVSDPF
jgi:hypothetical protein